MPIATFVVPFKPLRSLTWVVPFALLCCLFISGCSSTRNLPVLNEVQAELLDSTVFFGSQIPAESVLGQSRQHQSDLIVDSTMGLNALHLRWWKGPELAERIALPWPDSLPRDITTVEHLGGISIWLRKWGASQSNPGLVFELEDGSGHNSSVSIAAKHVPRFPLDSLWQEVRIPLTDFQNGKDQTDWSDIRSFNIRMEHFGEVLVGPCVLVGHEPRKKTERRAGKLPALPTATGKYILFQESADHEWGLGDFGEKRQFIIQEKRGRNKSQALNFEWDFSPVPFSNEPVKFPHHKVGFSWNGWQEMTPPIRPEQAFIVFKLRNIGVNQGPSAPLPISVGLANSMGQTSAVSLTQERLPGEGFGKWQECRIPFNAFDWATEESPNGLTSISYLYFEFSQKGHVFIDDISVKF